LLAALRRHHAALCAAPVGSGKTYIALAVAGAQAAGATCLVPAALVDQWRRTAGRLNIPLTLWSHERVSRGSLPPGDPALIIVDESHQFRNPATKRYGTLAPWLMGRALLLLTGTPVVNRPEDLFHQLHLGLRDDALALEGVASLRLALAAGTAPSALASVVATSGGTGARPAARHASERPRCGSLPLLPDLDALGLSSNPGIAALIRLTLLRSAASSAAAWPARSSALRFSHLALMSLQTIIVPFASINSIDSEIEVKRICKSCCTFANRLAVCKERGRLSTFIFALRVCQNGLAYPYIIMTNARP
jgi:hypothetical protein